jgi:hypothetical protein
LSPRFFHLGEKTFARGSFAGECLSTTKLSGFNSALGVSGFGSIGLTAIGFGREFCGASSVWSFAFSACLSKKLRAARFFRRRLSQIGNSK